MSIKGLQKLMIAKSLFDQNRVYSCLEVVNDAVVYDSGQQKKLEQRFYYYYFCNTNGAGYHSQIFVTIV